MDSVPGSWYTRSVVWWLHRNPLYLMSAACMAIGARLYLVSPGSYAGDIGLILVTLGVLQAYKWAVTTVLLLLHGSRRSPEDEPSLLLVAALFWTGPMAATIEMSAVQAEEGLFFAVGVLLFALLELAVVRRALVLQLSMSSRLLAGACLLLLVIAPWRLHVDTADGTNEIFLYFCWWLLGVVALFALGGLRARARDAAALGPLHRELAFVAIVLAATAIHLVGMNYAFVGHARAFYAAPLVLTASVVAFEYLARRGIAGGVPRILAAAGPLVALALATRPFDRSVPVEALPAGFRDALLTTLALATTVWWFGAWRNRSAGLFHLGSLALAGTVLRARAVLWTSSAAAIQPGMASSPRDVAALALFGLTVYLLATACVRRSRTTALLSLASLQAAVCLWTWGRTPAAPLVIGLVAGWSLLMAVHLGASRPSGATVLWPIGLMVALAWVYDFDAARCWLVRANTGVLILALLKAGQLWRSLHYRRMAALVVAANVVFFSGRGVAVGVLPVAALIVTLAFLLLFSGAAISWHKSAWLRRAWGRHLQSPASGEAGR